MHHATHRAFNRGRAAPGVADDGRDPMIAVTLLLSYVRSRAQRLSLTIGIRLW